jgi:hypothetical protein
VIGVEVGVHRLDQAQIQLADELEVAVHLLEHRVDDQRLAAAAAGEQVAVGAGDAVEQLAEDHGMFSSAAPPAAPVRAPILAYRTTVAPQEHVS